MISVKCVELASDDASGGRGHMRPDGCGRWWWLANDDDSMHRRTSLAVEVVVVVSRVMLVDKRLSLASCVCDVRSSWWISSRAAGLRMVSGLMR